MQKRYKNCNFLKIGVLNFLKAEILVRVNRENFAKKYKFWLKIEISFGEKIWFSDRILFKCRNSILNDDHRYSNVEILNFLF